MKRTLATSTQATIEIDSLLEGIDHSCSLSRARFGELYMDYSVIPWARGEVPARQRYRAKDNDLALMGGSTRISRVHDPRILHDEDPNESITLMKQWNMMLQCRAQSSQVKVL